MALAAQQPPTLAVHIPRTSSPSPDPNDTPAPHPLRSAGGHGPFLPPPSPPPSSSPPRHTPTPSASASTPASTAPCTPATSTPSSSSSSRSSLPGTAGPGSASASTLSVKFAPLPQLAPRRRRSTTPLGMAARGALVRGRRGAGAVVVVEEACAPVAVGAEPGTGAEAGETEEAMTLAELRWRQEEAAARYAHFQGSAYAQMARQTEAEVAIEEYAREAKLRARAADKGRARPGKERARDRGGEKGPEKEKDGEEPGLPLGKVVKLHFWRRRTTSSSTSTAAAGMTPPVPPLPDTTAIPTSGRDAPAPPTTALRHRKSADTPLRPILATLATNISPGSGARERGYIPYPGSRAGAAPGVEDEGLARQDGSPAGDQESRDGQDEDNGDAARGPADDTPENDDADAASRAWAAALGRDIPADIGQTQTIVAGRAAKAAVGDDEDDAEGP